MKGGLHKTPGVLGFTIVEVMVFLAVSGFTFLIAATFINGKEAQAEYRTGMNQANLQVQTIINNVGNGNYALPVNRSLNCTLGANGPNVHQVSVNSSLSAAVGCTFIGTVLSPNYNNNQEQYYLYTVAGCQYYTYRFSYYRCSNLATDMTPSNLIEEQPQVVSSLSRIDTWSNAIALTKIYKVAGGNWDQLSALGFFSSFPSMNNGVMESGSEPVALVYFNGNSSQTAQDIASLGSTNPAGQLLTNGYIVFCFQGATGQFGGVEIGSSNGGQQLTTSLLLEQKVPAQCQG